MQINSPNLIALGRTLVKLFEQQVDAADYTWSPEQISSEESSGTAENEYFWSQSDEKMRNWTGKMKEIANLMVRGLTAANQDWERTFEVSLKVLERDEFRKVLSLMESLSGPAAYWIRQMIVEAIINGGFPNDVDGKPIQYVWIDGQPFFSTQHLSNASLASSKKWANLHTGRALTSANVVYGRRKMMTIPGISGRPMGYQPRQIWIPPSLVQQALEISKAATVLQSAPGNGSAAPENVLRIWGLDVVEIPEIEDDTGTWYLAGRKQGKPPIRHQIEQRPRFASNAGSVANRFDGEIDTQLLITEKIVAGASARGTAFLAAPEVLHKFTP